jgi:site-specific recombinase XerD
MSAAWQAALAALPRPARRFVRTTANYRVHGIVLAFHHWLDRRQLTLAELTPALLRQFVACPRGTRVCRRGRLANAAWLRRYLLWLHARGLVPCVLPPGRHQPPPLPALARAFLASLVPTFAPATVHCYTFSLRKLYGWLEPRGLVPERLTRSQIERWLRWLHAQQLHPSSRHHVLVESRAYLRWLGERRRMRTAADDLIRNSDLPRIPHRLPRPLSAEADRELQRRLGTSELPAAWALLLMRRTGLRIGELRNLEYHCVRAEQRRPLLKVPLGKLRTERLVPLDATALALVRRLQATEPLPRAWLVPGAGGARASYCRIRRTLTLHCRALPEPTHITCHRLRHTFATEMLSAGMSLVGLMRLLGHRDYHMTLRYAAITPELVDDEYSKALARLATKYQLPVQPSPSDDVPGADELLDQLSRWVRKHASATQHIRPLLKRIDRLRREIRNFGAADSRP